MFEIGTSEIQEPMSKHFSLPVSDLTSMSIQINEIECKKKKKKEKYYVYVTSAVYSTNYNTTF